MTSEGEEYGESQSPRLCHSLKHAADKKSAIYFGPKSVKGLMNMFQGRHLISQLLE